MLSTAVLILHTDVEYSSANNAHTDVEYSSTNNAHSLPPCRHCSSYSGAKCIPFFNQNLKVFVNASTEQTIRDAFKVIQVGETYAGGEEHLSRCIYGVKAMICHSVFPYCDPAALKSGTALARPICQQSCRVFMDGGECAGVIDPSMEVYRLLMSNCDTRVSPGSDSPECIHVSMGIGKRMYLAQV